MKRGITTLPRFIFLNSYAILLLVIGGGVACLSLCFSSPWLLLFQVPAVGCLLYESLHIFSTWNSKKRHYNILIERNSREFNEKSFDELMQAPCGRLLVYLVLKDLGRQELYRVLRHRQRHFWHIRKSDFMPRKTTVFINPNYKK